MPDDISLISLAISSLSSDYKIDSTLELIYDIDCTSSLSSCLLYVFFLSGFCPFVC